MVVALLALLGGKVILLFQEDLGKVWEYTVPFPLFEILVSLLFLAGLGLLWTTYRSGWRSLLREAELQRVVASINPDVLIVVSPHRIIRSCNSAVKVMFGLEPREVIGSTPDMLYFDRRVNGEKGEIFNSLEKVGFHVGEAIGRRRDGSSFPLELITGLLQGKSGAVILMRDISSRRAIATQLVRAKEDAEAANRATSEAMLKLEQNFEKLNNLENLRDQLMHMIVHDLKSPLATISGYLGILKWRTAGKLEKSEAECIGESIHVTRRMNEMILSMLDLHRLENNEMPLNRKPCDLEKLAKEALDLVRSNHGGPQLSIVSPPRPVAVHCDPDVIRRVIVNLLDNAEKHTSRDGFVILRIEERDSQAEVSVQDTGCGIPAQFHAKIFERFAQVEAKPYSNGLGLAFCDLAVRAHGGQIGVESESGKGSRFWFTVPTGAPVPVKGPVRT